MPCSKDENLKDALLYGEAKCQLGVKREVRMGPDPGLCLDTYSLEEIRSPNTTEAPQSTCGTAAMPLLRLNLTKQGE